MPILAPSLTILAAVSAFGAADGRTTGRFEIIEADRSPRGGAVPEVHRWRGQQLDLRFSGPEGYVALNDDGTSLAMKGELAGCWASASGYAFSETSTEREIFSAMVAFVKGFRTCVDSDVLKAFVARLRGSRPGFAAAVAAFKARSAVKFRGMQRCVPPPPSKSGPPTTACQRPVF